MKPFEMFRAEMQTDGTTNLYISEMCVKGSQILCRVSQRFGTTAVYKLNICIITSNCGWQINVME